MIKGIRIGSTKENLKYYDELVVPIIENTVNNKQQDIWLCLRTLIFRSHSIWVLLISSLLLLVRC